VTLARFHARAERGAHIAAHGSGAAIARNVEENFVQANSALRTLVPEATEREIEERQLGFLAQQAGLFERRVASDKICDGHGDLRLEHVYLTDGASPIIIDCIEFNERFRFADACADVAFLSMDFAFHERIDFKERFLAAYARESHDYELYSVVDFYESYRAYVRAKVNALSLASAASFEARQRLERQARRYLLLALAAERPPLGTPRLIAVGGIIASGKSTFADALGAELGVPVISSDRTRKALLGIEPTEPLRHEPWQRAYAPELTAQVYEELMRLCRVVLRSGRSVVLDATFASRQSRAMARAAAAELSVPFCFVECRAPADVARARLRERASGASVSDGRLEIFDQFVARYEAVTELEDTEHFVADTTLPLPEHIRRLHERELIPERLQKNL
jgi:predicted kinase